MMHKLRTLRVPLSLKLLIAFVVLMLALFMSVQNTRSQGAGLPIVGYAWSDYIGWIKLNCTTTPNDCTGHTYNLGVDGSNVITGYAWSDYGGWISAYAADTAACGAGGAYIQGTAVRGWLRQLNISGTDGCIKLDPGGSQDVTYNTTTKAITGNAWGGDTIGWVAFNSASVVTPATCTMYPPSPASYYQMVPPANITLSYSTTDATSGSISGTSCSMDFSSGTKYCDIPAPTTPNTYVYTLNASGPGGACTPSGASVTVFSGWPPPTGCISIGVNNQACTNPVNRAESIKKNTSTNLFWNVSYASINSCSITRNGSAWMGSLAASSTQAYPSGLSTGNLSQRTEYTLTCTGLSGATFTDRAVINILPEFQEI